ncbi:hypothetical protein HN51_007153 [Arachis hypogaea]
MMETASVSLLPLMPLLLSTSLLFPSIKNPSTIIITFLLSKEINYINQNLLLKTSCNNNNNVNNNHHHHHQQPKLENFLGGHSFADHHHDYGANSSGDYLFQNCSQPEVTAGGGEGSAGGSGGSTNSIHHQHLLVKEVVKLKRIKRGLKFVERGIEIRVRKMIIWGF